MTNNITDAQYTLLDEPGEGFQTRNQIYTVAMRLIAHTKGKIAGGYRKNENGDMAVQNDAYAPGDLLLKDALYAVEFALTRGLNPYGHISMWYQRVQSSPIPLLIIEIDWKLLKGWAEIQAPFSSKPFVMSDEDRQRYGLQPGDLGATVYNILDSEAKYFHQYQIEFIKSGFKPGEALLLAAQAAAKSEGMGVVKAAEMTTKGGKPISPPKGRTWQWRAETRALRDAIRRSHGEPPPAQIRKLSAQGDQLSIAEKHIELLADPGYPVDTPPEIQQKYLETGAITEAVKSGQLVDKHPESVEIMRDRNGDDDPIEGGQDLPAAMVPSAEFWQYSNGIGMSREEAGAYLQETNGDHDKALRLLKKSVNS